MSIQSQAETTTGRWMALTAALLGWLFDGLEMGLFPQVARPSLIDLLGTQDDKEIGKWIGVAMASFLVGAATGGVLFGWLGDRLGRVRAMTLSILTYAVFTGLCGMANQAWQIAVLRFLSALGMGGEWSLGVALVMEIWPDRSRAFLAGLIGAAANLGYLLVGCLTLGLGAILESLPHWLSSWGLSEYWVTKMTAHSGWRILMLSGALPALLTFFIRLFVPESNRWEKAQARGTISNWAARDLWWVGIGALGAIAIIILWTIDLNWSIRLAGTAAALLVTTVSFLFPTLRFLQRGALDERGPSASHPTIRRMLLGACLSGVALLGTWASIQWAPSWADQLAMVDKLADKLVGFKITKDKPAAKILAADILQDAKLREEKLVQKFLQCNLAANHEAATRWARQVFEEIKDPNPKAYTQIGMAGGAILGTILAAFLGNWLGRRISYLLLCMSSLASALVFFQLNYEFGWMFLVTVFLAGGLTASFYGWLPLYLPELFRTPIRATGQGFSFNFGRIIAAIGALQTGNLMGLFKGSYPTACSIMSMIYLVGLAIIWLAPETHGKPLPD